MLDEVSFVSNLMFLKFLEVCCDLKFGRWWVCEVSWFFVVLLIWVIGCYNFNFLFIDCFLFLYKFWFFLLFLFGSFFLYGEYFLWCYLFFMMLIWWDWEFWRVFMNSFILCLWRGILFGVRIVMLGEMGYVVFGFISSNLFWWFLIDD